MPLPRTPADAYEKYSVKAPDVAVLTQRWTTIKEVMLKRAQVGIILFMAFNKEMDKILDEYGITGNNRIPYKNFGRKLLMDAQRYSGPALVKAVEAAKLYFVTRYGCNPEILDKIAALVLGSAPSY